MTAPAAGGGYTQIRYSLEDGVGRITLDRPDRLNSFTETVLRSVTRGEIMHWPARCGLRPIL